MTVTTKTKTETGTPSFTLNEAPTSGESVVYWKWLKLNYDGDFEYWKRKHPEDVKEAEESARNERRYREASPVKKIDIRIAEIQKAVATAIMLGNQKVIDDLAQEVADLEKEKRKLTRGKRRRKRKRGRAPTVVLCEGCGIHPADPPSKLSPGCEAYSEHQA